MPQPCHLIWPVSTRVQGKERCHSFSGFSVGLCINEEGYLLPTIAQKITCRRFDWSIQSKRRQVILRPDDDWSIQSKRRQVIFRAIVGNR